MSHYRREPINGATWFFTIVTHQRRSFLCDEPVRVALRNAIKRVQLKHPFEIDAWVLLPDHFHCVWTLPDEDSNFKLRISLLKRYVTLQCAAVLHRDQLTSASRRKRKESTIWQRRFWEHRICDDEDLKNHLDYIHYNPVKHGHCKTPIEWPYSTLHRLTQCGKYPANWASHTEPNINQTTNYGDP